MALLQVLSRRSVNSLQNAVAAGHLIIAGGITSAGAVSSSELRKFADDTSITGGNLTQAQTNMAGTGNASTAIFGGFGNSANFTNATMAYNYAKNTFSNSSAMTYAATYAAAFGTATVGYFAAGATGTGVYVGNVSKFTYANGSVSAGTMLTTGRRSPYGFGNTVAGYAALGYNNWLYTVEKYIYAGDVKTSSASMSVSGEYGVGCSNASTGLVMGGSSGATSGGVVSSVSNYRYDLSTYAQTTGYALASPGYQAAGGSGPTSAYVTGGMNASNIDVKTTGKYTYSTNTSLMMASLIGVTYRYNHSAATDCHGGL